MEKTEKWNRVASDYQKVCAQGGNDYNDKLIAFLLNEGMLHPGCRVLDLGCGVGKYGRVFASYGCDVTLADISPKMLEFAEKNMAEFKTPWRTLLCDFDDVSAEEAMPNGRYGLSISTMSPAVHSAETVKKFASVTDGWCFLATFSQWSEPDRDELFKSMGVKRQTFNGNAREECGELIRSVSAAGFTPQVKYVDYCWSDERSVDDTVQYMLERYFEPTEQTAELRESMYSAVTELSQNGVFTDRVNTKVAWIYWSTK